MVGFCEHSNESSGSTKAGISWSDEGLSASQDRPKHHITPVFVPPVKIHAPVVFAAFSKPLRKTFLSFGCNSKLALPPCTVIRSFGSSKLHSLVNSCRIISGLVSYARRTYCNNGNTQAALNFTIKTNTQNTVVQWLAFCSYLEDPGVESLTRNQ